MGKERLTVLTLDETERWDKTVKSFQNYDIYYLSGYVKAFKLHGDGQPLLFYYDDGETRGMNVLMKRDISVDERFRGKIMPDTLFDVTTPYGYGGWLAEGNTDSMALFDAYESWCIKNHVVSEFVRFHPVLGNHLYSEKYYNVTPLGETVAMDLDSRETIWENLTSKNRNMVRKAQKSGIKIYHGNFPEIYEKFREIYNATMDKDNACAYYYFGKSFYDSLIEDLPYNAQVFYAKLDGRVIAASIMLAANGRMSYHLSGSEREYSSLAPTNLLLYRAALWGCENGCKTLYLGGGVGSGEDSLFKFKRAFYKGELNRFYIGKKVYSEEKYEELVRMRGNFKSQYFPLYRAENPVGEN